MRNDNYHYHYRYDYSYGYPGYHLPPSDGTNWLERIKPDIKNLHRAAKKKMIAFIILTAICPIIFLVGVILFAIMGDNFYPNFAFLPVFLLGLFGSGLSTALLIVYIIKIIKLSRIVSLVNKIEAQDKTNLQDLSKSKNITKDGLVLIINKLIETDNLRGYKVIGNVGVAKVELNAKERDFPQEKEDKEETASSKNAQRRYKCPNCGANITEQTEKFCTYCGTRLE